MRTFANLFLILFFADGAVSIADELFSLFAVGALSPLRNMVAEMVVLLCLLVYPCLGIDRRLPKQIFIPAVAFIFWSLVGTWLFPSLAGSAGYGAFMAAAQLSLARILLTQVRSLENEESFLFTETTFDGPAFSMRNTLLFAAPNLLIVPVALILLFLATASASIAEATAGFIRLAPDGLYMTEKTYRKEDRTVRLAGMIHFGEKEYYDDLVASVAGSRTVVLAEGVTDREKLLANRIGYGKMAGLLGLTSQEKMRFSGRLIEQEELDRPPAADAAVPDIVRADVDMKTFRPSTIRFLDEAGKALAQNESIIDAALALNSWVQRNMTEEMNKTLLDDILTRRNGVVLGYLEKALGRYEIVVIPWGALHMADIEKGVRDRGFTLREERERLAIDFGKLAGGR